MQDREKKNLKEIWVDQYGKTHYVEVDTFKPEAKKSDEPQSQVGDDLPFQKRLMKLAVIQTNKQRTLWFANNGEIRLWWVQFPTVNFIITNWYIV